MKTKTDVGIASPQYAEGGSPPYSVAVKSRSEKLPGGEATKIRYTIIPKNPTAKAQRATP